MNAIIEWFMRTIGQYISAELSVFLISMIPLVEERGGLIVARLLGLPLGKALLYCVAGNILPIPFILFFIKSIFHWMSDHHMSRIVEKMEEKAAKNKPKIDRYGFWGLALFVGIPLPGTGAWTGSLVAALFDMDLKKASLSILIGIALAAFIMTVLSYQVMGSVIG
ncbi:MAG: small multi-drug export protein [Solobacterium sp.]|nr:small multi-drug export protein [Erysipelotrichaceae bacterium]MBQ2688826.1 small multi-drug export protein [Solobacterium sp.]MBQ6591278.1 small multi-drug export protein [Solobacterium sp.]MBR0478907.1 small multi-drug export protein [Solobacterium sp.]MCR5372972.1 small multi-drug export protein [Solobacterium sp.]